MCSYGVFCHFGRYVGDMPLKTFLRSEESLEIGKVFMDSFTHERLKKPKQVTIQDKVYDVGIDEKCFCWEVWANPKTDIYTNTTVVVYYQ